MRMRSWGLLAIAAMACCGTTQAQPLRYEFWINGAPVPGNNYNIPAIGGTVTATLYLVDTGAPLVGYPGANQTLTGNLRANALVGFGVRIPNALTQSARVLANSGVTVFDPIVPDSMGNDQHFGFNFQGLRQVNTTQIAIAYARLGDGGIEPPVPPQFIGQVPVTDATPAAPAGKIRLADFLFTAASLGNTQIVMSDPIPGQGDTQLGNVNNPAQNGGLGLDPVGQTSFLYGQTLTISVGPTIPEPSSMILGGIALASMGGLKFRRKKAKAEVAVAV